MTIQYKLGDKDTRPWGSWKTIDIGEKHIVKRLVILPQQSVSLQMHNFRSEHWIIVEGEADITLGEETKRYTANNHVYIPVKEKHRIANPLQIPLVFIEVQTGDTLDETDIIRFEDKYGRI